MSSSTLASACGATRRQLLTRIGKTASALSCHTYQTQAAFHTNLPSSVTSSFIRLPTTALTQNALLYRLAQTRRSFHTSPITCAEPAAPTISTTQAKPTSAAAFWATGGIDPKLAAAAPNTTAAAAAPFLTMTDSVAAAAAASPFAGQPATHIVHVLLTANNTICTLTNLKGDTKAWSSSGTAGFKNAKKSTYMACIAAGEQLGQKARNQNIQHIDMHISGFHKNKKAVLKGLMKAGLNIVAIRDTTPIPFNGCKPKKQRRL